MGSKIYRFFHKIFRILKIILFIVDWAYDLLQEFEAVEKDVHDDNPYLKKLDFMDHLHHTVNNYALKKAGIIKRYERKQKAIKPADKPPKPRGVKAWLRYLISVPR